MTESTRPTGPDAASPALLLPSAAAVEARIGAAIAAELGVRPAQVRAGCVSAPTQRRGNVRTCRTSKRSGWASVSLRPAAFGSS